MGLLRRILGALIGSPSPKAEDIVFEPIGGPNTAVAALNQPLPQPLPSEARGAAHRVALGDLMARVPSAWKRSVDFVPEQMVDLPATARMNAGAERPLAFSLRYLVRLFPVFFRDPGMSEVDVGVDLAMEPLREPEPVLDDLPLEVVQEAEGEPETFAQWEGDAQSERARLKEAKETQKALKSVRMPLVKSGEKVGFEELLEVPAKEAGDSPSLGPGGSAAAPPAQVNGRLRKILEAYAQGITPPQKPAKSSEVLSPQQTGERITLEVTPKERTLTPIPEPAFSRSELTSFVEKKTVIGVPIALERTTEPARSEPPVLHQTRFDELGLSLSRFSEVKGFALWLGEHAMQTGDLGLDTQAATTRFRMDKILESASLTHGAQDGFLSVTVHHARGGISIFGGGFCLVAVSHNAEGMPPHLRSWLCGWVSQPLRS